MLLDTHDTTAPDLTSETTISERRLAANRANAQLSTGPISAEGKAKSSLNAVKTGLCGRAVLLADAEEADAYREHVERVYAYWAPANCEEHALVQSLADTQWRLESIPGLESALYAGARLRGTPVLQHSDPTIQRLLWDGQTEVAEAKALKNLRLHERRLRRQFEQDKAELNQLRQERFEQEAGELKTKQARRQEKAKREREKAEQQQKQARQGVPVVPSETALLDAGGFEFANCESLQESQEEGPETVDIPAFLPLPEGPTEDEDSSN